MNYSPDALAALDLKAGFPQKSVPEIVEIQLAESSGNPLSVGYDANGKTVQDTQGADASVPFTSYDTGLAQINSSHDTGAPAGQYDLTWIQKMQNPLSNTKEALALSGGGTNFSAWADDGVPARGSWPVGNQALQDVLTGSVSPITSTPAGSTAGASGTSTSSSGSSNAPSNGVTPINYTGFPAVLQQIAKLMAIPSLGSGLGAIAGTLTGSTEEKIAEDVEGFAVRIFFSAAFAAIAYIGIKTITTGSGKSGGNTTIFQGAQQRQRVRNAATNAETAQQETARKAQAAQLQYESAQQQRAHEAQQARLSRAAATRAANRARQSA